MPLKPYIGAHPTAGPLSARTEGLKVESQIGKRASSLSPGGKTLAIPLTIFDPLESTITHDPVFGQKCKGTLFVWLEGKQK